MRLKIKLDYLEISTLVLILTILGSLFTRYIYIYFAEAHLIRIILPFAFIVLFSKSKIKIDDLGILVLLFYIFFFLITSVVSIFYFKEIKFNDWFNFVIVTLYVITLILYAYKNPRLFLKVLFQCSLFFFALSFAVVLYEVVSLNHLSGSVNFEMDKAQWWNQAPTGFQFNPNDLASGIMLLVMFIIAYIRVFEIKLAYWKEFLFLIVAGWMAYETQARLIQIIFFLVFVTYYIRYIMNLKFLLLIAILAMAAIKFFPEHIEKVLIVMNMGENLPEDALTSTDIRLNLYKHGALSIFDSFGFGFGIQNSDYFYNSIINHKELFGEVSVPHMYFIELILYGGLLPLLLWGGMYFIFVKDLFKHFIYTELRLFTIVFPILLMSSSTSIFKYMFYLFFIGFVAFIRYNKLERNRQIEG